MTAPTIAVSAPAEVKTAASAAVPVAPARPTCDGCNLRPALLDVTVLGARFDLCGDCLDDYAALGAA